MWQNILPPKVRIGNSKNETDPGMLTKVLSGIFLYLVEL